MVQFITSNPAIEGFQRAETHRIQTEAGDLANQFSRQAMPDRLRQQRGAADASQAAGEVAMATRGDQIAKSGISVDQARQHLRSTTLSNEDKEIDLTGEIAARYEAGLIAEGDQIVRQLGKDPNDPGIQALKQDREYRGVVLRAIEEAKQQFGTAEKRQKFVEARIQGYAQGRTKPNDFGAGYASDPSFPDRDTTQQIGWGKGYGTTGTGRRPLSWEAKRDAFVAAGYDPKDALDFATGLRKPPDDMKTRSLIERMVETERRGGFLDDSQIQARRAELVQEFGVGAAPAPVPAAPQASAAPASPQMAGYDFNFIHQGGVVAPGSAPNGGNPEAMRQGLQRQGQSLLSQVEVPTDPTSGRTISASQAATVPSGGQGAASSIPTTTLPDGRTAYKPRTRAEAMALPKGAVFVDPRGNVVTRQ